jgi:hypothetical protein
MSSVLSFGGGGPTQPLNPANTYEALGYGTNGSITTITSGGIGAKGSYASIGTTANSWCGFEIDFQSVSANGNRYLMDIRTGGATVIVPNLFLQSVTGYRLYIPIAIASGTLIEARVQSTASGGTVKLGISGHIASASLPPGFTTAVDILGADTTNTRPSTAGVAAASTLTWAQILASTSEAYGALMMTCADNGTLPATAQSVVFSVGTGAAASEVGVGRTSSSVSTSSPAVSRAARLLEVSVASGTRLSGAVQAATPGTDTFLFGLHGFK